MAWLCGFPEHAPGALFGPCDPGAGLHALTGAAGGPRAPSPDRRGPARRVPDGGQRAERRRRAGHRVLGQRRPPRPHRQPRPRRRAAELLRRRRTGTTTSTSTAGCRSRWPPTSSGGRCAPRSASRRGRRAPSSTRWPGGWPPTTSSIGELAAWCAERKAERDRRRAVVGRRPVRRRRAPVGEPDDGAARPPALLRARRAPRPRRLGDRHVPVPAARRRPVPSTAGRRRCSASTTARCSATCSACPPTSSPGSTAAGVIGTAVPD